MQTTTLGSAPSAEEKFFSLAAKEDHQVQDQELTPTCGLRALPPLARHVSELKCLSPTVISHLLWYGKAIYRNRLF